MVEKALLQAEVTRHIGEVQARVGIMVVYIANNPLDEHLILITLCPVDRQRLGEKELLDLGIRLKHRLVECQPEALTELDRRRIEHLHEIGMLFRPQIPGNKVILLDGPQDLLQGLPLPFHDGTGELALHIEAVVVRFTLEAQLGITAHDFHLFLTEQALLDLAALIGRRENLIKTVLGRTDRHARDTRRDLDELLIELIDLCIQKAAVTMPEHDPNRE